MRRGGAPILVALVGTAVAFLIIGWSLAGTMRDADRGVFRVPEGDEVRSGGPLCIIVDGDILIAGHLVSTAASAPAIVLISEHGDIMVTGTVVAPNAVGDAPGIVLAAPEGEVRVTGSAASAAGVAVAATAATGAGLADAMHLDVADAGCPVAIGPVAPPVLTPRVPSPVDSSGSLNPEAAVP